MNVLYVAHDKYESTAMCPGSTVCLSLIDKLPAKTVSIQDCDILRETNTFPEWLDGTPIFVNEHEGVPYRGRDAIRKLRDLVEYAPLDTPEAIEPSNTPNKRVEHPDHPSQVHHLDDHFKMDVTVNEETKSEKITEADLQKYMELRNQSKASQQPAQPQVQQ